MPRYNSKLRRWVDDEGHIIPVGKGYATNRDDQTITQYNTDGSISRIPWRGWTKNKTLDHELRVLQNDRLYGIPNVEDKQITLTIDKSSPTRRNAGATYESSLANSLIDAIHQKYPKLFCRY